MTIRFAEKSEYPAVLDHYLLCRYNAGLSDTDQVVIALEDEIIGAVRIASENNVKVLRGMQVAPEWQREGIGLKMLQFLAEHIDLTDCYCLPYRHLIKFYGSIGFEVIDAKNAPSFLTERLKGYVDRGLDTIIMRKTNKTLLIRI